MHDMHRYVFTLFGTCKINTPPKFNSEFTPEKLPSQKEGISPSDYPFSRVKSSVVYAGCPYATKQCITSEPYMEKLQQGVCTEKNVTLKKPWQLGGNDVMKTMIKSFGYVWIIDLGEYVH